MVKTQVGKTYPKPDEEKAEFDDAWADVRKYYKVIKENQEIGFKMINKIKKLQIAVEEAIKKAEAYNKANIKWESSQK